MRTAQLVLLSCSQHILCVGWSQRPVGHRWAIYRSKDGCCCLCLHVSPSLVSGGCDSTSDCPTASQSLHQFLLKMIAFLYGCLIFISAVKLVRLSWNTGRSKFEAHTKAMASFNAGPAACPKSHLRGWTLASVASASLGLLTSLMSTASVVDYVDYVD